MHALFTSIWGVQEETPCLWNDPHLLSIGNAVSAILTDVPMVIKIPRMITIGSQSSGKSSVLNSLLVMDLLPTGKNMVTRTPLRLELVKSHSDTAIAEFGVYNEIGLWMQQSQFRLSLPVPTSEEVQRVRDRIEQQTIRLAGEGANISSTEINIRFSSPAVHQLTLIDLPGLTYVACTDRGQPRDIRQKITELLSTYIAQEESIILAILPARNDIEADPSLALVKQFDPMGSRTIGILTKVDLMERDSHIVDYLCSNISVDLSLRHGYFAIKNRSSAERQTSTAQGIALEKGYFDSHPIYKNVRARCGIPALARYLTTLLLDEVKRVVPIIRLELCTLEQQLRLDLQSLGEPIPETKELQLALVHKLFLQFSSLFQKGASRHTGRAIKEAFIAFRSQISSVTPFSPEHCSDDFLQTMLRNCEGNHMNCVQPPIEALEACLLNKEHKAFDMIVPYTQQLVHCVQRELQQLVNSVARTTVGQYPPLLAYVTDTLGSIIERHGKETIQSLLDIVHMEASYVWTDDPKFHQVIEQNIRVLLSTYFEIIVTHLQHFIPKAVMHGLVLKIQEFSSEYLLAQLDAAMVSQLLVEFPTVFVQRDAALASVRRIVAAREILNGII
jgi:GTP-binding protein EngB required for normal cell division